MFAKTLDDFSAIAAAKAAFSRDKPLAFFVSAMLAGAYVGIGIILIFTLGQQIEPALRSLVMGACFGIALTLVVFAGSDLFTGHTMFMTIGLARGTVDGAAVARSWIFTWVGNLAGAVLLALVFWLGGGGQILKDGADLIFAASAAKMGASATALDRTRRAVQLARLPRAVDQPAGNQRRGQMHPDLVVPVRLHRRRLRTLDRQHDGVFAGAARQPPGVVSLAGAAYNLLWVTIGNVIGGAVFVAGGYLAASPAAERKVLAGAPAE